VTLCDREGGGGKICFKMCDIINEWPLTRTDGRFDCAGTYQPCDQRLLIHVNGKQDKR